MTKFKLGDAVTCKCAIVNSTPYGVVKAISRFHSGQSFVIYNDGYSGWTNDCYLEMSVPSWDSLSEGMKITSKGTLTPHIIVKRHNNTFWVQNLVSRCISCHSMYGMIEHYRVVEDVAVASARKLLEDNGYKVI